MRLYITHLTRHFSATCSTRNYVSRVRMLHKESGLTPLALESIQVSRHLYVNATAVTSSHPSSTAPSPLLHPSQPGGPQSCCAGVPHLRFLRLAQAVELGASVCWEIFMAPLGLQILVQWIWLPFSTT